jgi:7,8-dihydropterin-6-yl-methyl-4-(beta-D-ribofuranosyl)aminobenzene 5'-phosphate synthase
LRAIKLAYKNAGEVRIFRIFKKLFIFLLFLSSFICFTEDINFTVVYNNIPFREDLRTAWGISIFIEGLEKNILFDTGGDGSILLSNMEKLEIDPKEIEAVILSHIHLDHIGGIEEILEKNENISVYIPYSFPVDFKNFIGKNTKEVVSVEKPIKVCKRVYSTGELGTGIKEQSLVIHTKKGLIIITGCAHPGIVNIVRFARNYFKSEIYLVIGGFHLMAYSEKQVNDIIKQLRELGVKKVGPSHCTGGRPIELFKEEWGDDFIDLGCGAKIKISLSDEN